jgi:hypothetical protein
MDSAHECRYGRRAALMNESARTPLRSPASEPGIRIKAAWLRPLISVLIEEHKLDAVKALVPPDTAALLVRPPLETTWIDFQHNVRIIEAIEKLAGTIAVRDFSRKMTDKARKPYLRIVEGLLRMFGTSPATLFKRVDDIARGFVTNHHFKYAPINERSGMMEIFYDVDYPIPDCIFVSSMPSFETLLNMCGVKGMVYSPERLGPQRARFRIEW